MQLLEGTSGYSYKAWKGSFYPADLPAARMLECYAARLPAVEINNTFYRMPKSEVVARWREQVPEHFRFVIKASRRITHVRRLVDAEEETDYLLRTLEALGEQLGGVLFQLPPFLKADVERLSAFLERLPPSLPATFEFRHASWNDEDVRQVLRDAACGICVTDADQASAREDADETAHPQARAADVHEEPSRQTVESSPLPVTAAHAYLRLRAVSYSDAELAAWLERLYAAAPERAFVFFKHEDEATGPALAARLRRLHEAAGTKRG